MQEENEVQVKEGAQAAEEIDVDKLTEQYIAQVSSSSRYSE